MIKLKLQTLTPVIILESLLNGFIWCLSFFFIRNYYAETTTKLLYDTLFGFLNNFIYQIARKLFKIKSQESESDLD